MLTATRYSCVGEHHVDVKIEKLECQKPKNLPQEERPHGCSISSVLLAKEQVNTKIIPLSRKVVGIKIVIRAELCMKKVLLIYMDIKTELNQLIK